MRSPNPRVVARHLAIAALAGPWNAVALARRFVASFRPAPHWLADLARERDGVPRTGERGDGEVAGDDARVRTTH